MTDDELDSIARLLDQGICTDDERDRALAEVIRRTVASRPTEAT